MTNGESKPCNLIPPTPTSIRGAVGVAAQAKLDLETPMICGGIQLQDVSNECWVLYDKSLNISDLHGQNTSWIEGPPMLEPRGHAASVKVLEAGMTSEWNWWVSGGFDHEQNRPDRDDYIDIMYDNIKENYTSAFKKKENDWSDLL